MLQYLEPNTRNVPSPGLLFSSDCEHAGPQQSVSDHGSSEQRLTIGYAAATLLLGELCVLHVELCLT